MKKESSGLGWLFVVVAVVALVSFGWTIVKRVRTSVEEKKTVAELAEGAGAPSSGGALAPAPSPSVEPPVPLPIVAEDGYAKRPAKVRNLLMRLMEAERLRDVEMAVTTIETIRALPGSPAADIDDSLARRLGELNMRRLFELRNAQWVKAVTIGRGDSASRIASENGSTLAALARLNGGSVNRIVAGKDLYVMNHPRFSLVIRRRTRIADLSLNGKFFKRYDLLDEVKARDGTYEMPEKRRQFWMGSIGSQFKAEDRAEIDMLLPRGAPVLVSEM